MLYKQFIIVIPLMVFSVAFDEVSFAAKSSQTWNYLIVGEYEMPYPRAFAIDVEQNGKPQIMILMDDELEHITWSGNEWKVQATHTFKNAPYIPDELHFMLASDGTPYTFLHMCMKNHPQVRECQEVIGYVKFIGTTSEFHILDQRQDIDDLAVTKDVQDNFHVIYTYAEHQHTDSDHLAYGILSKDSHWKIRTVITPIDFALSRFVAVDAHQQLHVSYVTTAYQTTHEETLHYLSYDGMNTMTQIVMTGHLGHQCPIIITDQQTPSILVYDFQQENIQWSTLQNQAVTNTIIPYTMDGQLPYIRLDSHNRLHLCYMSDAREAYVGRELKYMIHAEQQWREETIDYGGMRPNLQFAVDGQGNPHILYHVMTSEENTLKYATTFPAFRGTFPQTTVAERPNIPLDPIILPIDPKRAEELVRNFPQVRKNLEWAENLEITHYPTDRAPYYLFHHYAVNQWDDHTGTISTAGWYYVDPWTGIVKSDEEEDEEESLLDDTIQKNE